MILSTPAAGPGADQRLGAEALQLLGRAHAAADGRGPGQADHAGVSERGGGGCGGAIDGLHAGDCPGAERVPSEVKSSPQRHRGHRGRDWD